MITNEVIESYINCQYKAERIFNNERGEKSEFDTVLSKIYLKRRQDYFVNISTKYYNRIYDFIDFKKKYCDHFPYWIKNPTIIEDGVSLSIDAFQITSNKNQVVELIPVLVISSEKVNKLNKLYLYVLCRYFTEYLMMNFKYAKIIYGHELKTLKIKVQQYISEGDKIYFGLKKLVSNRNIFFALKKQHCLNCEFQIHCITILKEKDDLSLLGRISQKEINKLNNTGIFTIKQLSYKFKPKKRKSTKLTERNVLALKSLAIRENKTFVISKPEFPQVQHEIFIDFESLPDENYVYLIGLILWDGKKTEHKYYWAESKEYEESIFKNLFNFLLKFEEYRLYHFGSFEIKELQKFNKKNDSRYDNIISQITLHSINILSYFRTHIYPPIYSNGLKDIAVFLSFKWSYKNANGLTCVVWRKSWELNNQEFLKKQIVEYNQNDCTALRLVHIWLKNINNENIINVEDISIETSHKFGNLNSIVDNFNRINNCAWFDYQRSKVYLKTNPQISKALSTKKLNSHNRILRIDKTIIIDKRESCPYCNHIKPHKSSLQKKNIIDLKVMPNGLKKIVIQYIGRRFHCPVCRKSFFPQTYSLLGNSKYGHNLKSWCTNLLISHKMSFADITNVLLENFDISASKSRVYDFKKELSIMLTKIFETNKREIISGNLIHVDETKINLQTETGYIWAFTNMATVFYIYTSTRETKFLDELLKDFKGVLISDFYTGYDSLKCSQQKCLVHLIRDLNDDLLKNQFDEEYKLLVIAFSNLLNTIVETIDKYGLKKRNLFKHFKDVDVFYEKFILSGTDSEIGIKYQKRFKKYRVKLFAFLNYDNIPWNNNNAEHAFKHIAIFRQKSNGHHTLKGVNDTLLLMGIYQTCKYRNISFLKFLYSRENKISEYQEKYNTKGILKNKYISDEKLKATNNTYTAYRN